MSRPGCDSSRRSLTLTSTSLLHLFIDHQIKSSHRYYLTNAEIEVLEAYAEQIARRVQPGSVVVELGSGYVLCCPVLSRFTKFQLGSDFMCRNLRKVNILLQAIDRLEKDVEYYAVDLSLPELQRTFSQIPTGKSVTDCVINLKIWVEDVACSVMICGA